MHHSRHIPLSVRLAAALVLLLAATAMAPLADGPQSPLLATSARLTDAG